ncbi:MAG: FAD-binding protein [Gammaproteobacteria bacterium]|nr:FAD-binding protein [Gammaproteobacteria bacterium]
MSNAVTNDLYSDVVGATRSRKPKHTANQIVTVTPKSADEIAAVLIDPERYPTPVRPRGSGSSTTRATRMVTGTVIDMTGLTHVLGRTADTITVQAGITIRDLLDYLEEDGYELSCRSSNNDRTVGGAASSPTFSNALEGDVGNFAAGVVSLTLINALGRKVDVNSRMAELLSLSRNSYGLLGVIYSVTLRIRPIVCCVTRHSRTEFDEFARLVPALTTNDAGLHATCNPFKDRVDIEQRCPADQTSRFRMLPAKLLDWSPSVVVPLVMEQTGKFRKLLTEGTETNCCWFFPAHTFANAILTYQKFCLKHHRETRYRCDLAAEVWRVAQDDSSLLSPSFDGPAFALNIRSTRREGWDDFLLGFAEFAAHFRGLPVFNQTPSFRPTYARRIYGERLHRFRAMRQRLDPEDRLLNQYFAEHLG